MKPSLALPLVLLLSMSAQAEDQTAPVTPRPAFNILSPAVATPEWKPTPETGRARSTNSAPGIASGSSGYTARGPLMEGFRDSKWREVPRRFLSLFVPQKLPRPPGGGGPGYFAWKGESPHAWAAVAGAGAAGGPAFASPLTHEPDYSWVSVGR